MLGKLMNSVQRSGGTTVVVSSEGRGWRGLEAELLRVAPGRTHVPAATQHRLGIHMGPPVNADCRCDGRAHRRIQKHGDIDIVPAGLDGFWEDDRECVILRLKIDQSLFHRAMSAIGRDPNQQPLVPTFQLRDPRLETIAWAIKAELEANVPSDLLYAETLALGLAIRMAEAAGACPQTSRSATTLSSRQKAMLADFIECNLETSLSLGQLANLLAVSLTHLKAQFVNSFGMPPHRYILNRRVERAKVLLAHSDLPMSQIALKAGFSHQSHMATTMKRILGQTPREILRHRV
jgi:AraC family transcriptional regulator